MHPKNLSIKDFTYHLPEDKIAFHPLAERDSSKLLVYKNGTITGSVYKNLADFIPEDSLLIFNNTKVVEARLLFQKSSGGVIEIFCLEPHEQYPDITTAMMQHEKVLWKCLIGGASKWKHGQVLEKKIEDLDLQCRFVEKRTDCFIVEISWDSNLSFAEILHKAGAIPLPPYIKRKAEAEDSERYQTVYAKFDGSVAAPTAGLHFTPTIFEELRRKTIQTDFVTLHVSAGTFKPVKVEVMEKHEMHAEFIEVSKETIRHLLENLDKTIVAVGTTSLRTIESLYWLGVKSLEPGVRSEDPIAIGLEVTQWEPYEFYTKNIPAEEALNSLLKWMEKNKAGKLVTKTQIIIAPGYKPKIAKALITNFHQPQSTLLLLVSALIGDDWRKVYDYALENDFRFLSYGDGSIMFF
ncbi:MAG: S-adenosylmethionine:tRNA ribosyltransferase-isomerase [Bacteroidetes bacterium]|nr:MAG: S-adenosylmethionine:tRNA ribosyltransferase-isomerase [Bacteroidota bacterium]